MNAFLKLTDKNEPKIRSLIQRLHAMKTLAKSRPQNRAAKFDPSSEETKTFAMDWTETFFLYRVFRVKSKDSFSRNIAKAKKVLDQAGAGIHSWSTVAAKAETLHDRIMGFYPELTGKTAKVVHVDHAARAAEDEADRVRDMRRLERLADEAEKRDLRSQCEKLQPECWGLACKLDRRDACPLLPPGFKAMGTEDLRRLCDSLVKTRASYTAEIADRVRVADEKRAAEARAKAEADIRAAEAKAKAESLKPKYLEVQRLIRNLVDFAAAKRVRLARIELPAIETLDDAKLDTFTAKLKSFRVTIEQRARELDPVKTRHRISNPSALASPIAA